MDKQIIEAYKAVQSLNIDLDEEKSPEYLTFNMETNGFEILIKFKGIILYYSEDDDLWYEDINGTDQMYSIEQYCRVKFEELKENMNKMLCQE